MLQSFHVPAGGRQINAEGSWFQYRRLVTLSGSQEVRVRADGQDCGLFLPGDHVELPAPAKTWQVEPVDPNATIEVRIGAARMGTARIVGDVSVVDAIAPNCVTVLESDVTVGVTVRTMLAPASNTRGAIVRAANTSFQPGVGGFIVVRIYAAPIAPSGGGALVPGGASCLLLDGRSTDSANLSTESLLDSRRQIPPGWGLFAVKDAGGVLPIGCGHLMSFELL